MKMGVVGLTVTLAARIAFGGIQYEFQQTTRTDSESSSAADFMGRAVIDGQSSRVDFLGGNAYPPGTFVISTDGSRTLTFVDPSLKSYTQVSASTIASAIGATKITVDHLQSNLITLDDHPSFAGIPTNHYQLSIDYDITVTFGALPLSQHVHTTIDKWTTTRFGEVGPLFLANNLPQTGNPKLDEVIKLEASKVKGFPLKQIIQVNTRADRAPAPDSKLEWRPSRTRTHEMTITSIREVATNASLFTFPVVYKRSDPLRVDPKKSQVTILSLEPAK